jgi:hypothetical protein
MNNRKRFLISLCLGPDVLGDKDIVEPCSCQIEKRKRKQKYKKELQVFFFEYILGNQVVDSKIGDHNIQGKFNEVRFQ